MQGIEKCCEEMYKFEDNDRLFDFRFKDTGIPMWMYIRCGLIEYVEDKNIHNIGKQISESRKNKKQIKKGVVNEYIKRNPFFTRKKDVVFAFWEYQQLKQHDDGGVYDDFINPFLRIFPERTTTLMDGELLNEYELDCTHPNWKMDDIFIKLKKYKKAEVNAEDKKNIREFIVFLEKNCPIHIENDAKKSICRALNSFAKYSKYMINLCKLYLQIVKPKVVIMHCASYPSLLRTSMVLACKHKKVITAELQHCWVGKTYSYGYYSDCILRDSVCCSILPDYFLTYGEYWHDHIKMSSQCYVIGYTQYLKKQAIVENDSILFCAGMDFARYEKFLDVIIPYIDKNVKIYMRLHPVFSTEKQRRMFEKYTKSGNVIMANEKDLSFYMERCRYVITDSCTVPFEALFNGRIVFCLSGGFCEWVGIYRFSDAHIIDEAEDFMALWEKRNELKPKYYSDFFDLNYKKNYIEFLRECGVSK